MYQLRLDYYPNSEVRISATAVKCPGVFLFEKKDTPPYLTLMPNSEGQSQRVFPPRKVRADTVFTKLAKRSLQRIGGAVDREFEPSESLFLTATFPAASQVAAAAIATYAPYFVDRLKSWLYYRSPGCPWFYVWEFQKRGVLHLHMCVSIRESGAREYIRTNFKAECARLIDAIAQKSGVNVWMGAKGMDWSRAKERLQSYAQPVEKSVGRYLAKYCSKSFAQYGKFPGPKRWWGASSSARELLRKHSGSTEILFNSFREAYSVLDEWDVHINNGEGVRYEFDHRYRLGKTVLHFGSDTNLAESICMKKISSKRFGGTRDEPPKRVVDAVFRLSSLLRSSRVRQALAASSPSSPLRLLLHSLAQGTVTLGELSPANLQELRFIVMDSGVPPLTKEIISRVTHDIAKCLNLDSLPELRSAEPACEFDNARPSAGSVADSDADKDNRLSDRPTYVQLSL